MKKIILLSIVSFLFSAVYDDGDIVSTEHQNIVKETCYAGNGYTANVWTNNSECHAAQFGSETDCLLANTSNIWQNNICIDTNHTNETTCLSSNNWSLADWNGNVNGGSYNVTFLEMSTTW